MPSWTLSVAFVAIAVTNASVAFLHGVRMPLVGLSILIAVGFAIPLQHALRNGAVHTMQDGLITYAESPLRFLGVMALIIAGYVGGLLAPWVVK
jgi:hypothetical protein